MGCGTISSCVLAAVIFTMAIGVLIGDTPLPESPLQEPVGVEKVDFERDVQPIFDAHCYSCHGRGALESNFRLDQRSVALGPGDLESQPIVAGKSGASALIRYVSGADEFLIMPPEGKGKRLDEEQIETLRNWIDQGAEWPDELAGESDAKITTDLWSLQPIGDIEPPAIDHSQLPQFTIRNEIDSFVASRLMVAGIQASPPADRVTLIRRILLDMHGLQPTPEQVRAFVEDTSDDAVANLIETALASHHYGERWARHWLDVVRFGESTGYEVNRDRSNGYFYRDYVIDALNHDKSYRDFVIEQLAGDAVGVDEATGFLVGGPNDIVKSPDINLTLMQRQDELADYVNTTSTTFLGLTVGCARCHNHKFDPILQKDYYSLQAVFAGVQHGERKLESRVSKEQRDSLNEAVSELKTSEELLQDVREAAPAGAIENDGLLPMVNAKLNSDSFEPVKTKFVRFTIRRTNQAEPCIDELEIFSAGEEKNVALVSLGSVATSSGNYSNDPKHQLKHVNDGKYGNEFSWISDSDGTGWVQIEFPEPATIHRVDWSRERNGKYADRLAIDYSIGVSDDGETLLEVFNSNRRQLFWANGQEPEEAFIARLAKEDAEPARLLFEKIEQLRKRVAELNQAIPVGYVGTFQAAEPIFRLYRGDPMAPREEVSPDVLTVMGSLGLDTKSDERTRRLKLAEWIASDKNPLTARVIVNRVWQYHFGQGLVSTPSDFGKNGATPTHPELLDWLATRFMENGWSLKWLHREILSSSTYQQSSYPCSDALAQDAGCQLLWRFPPRRLEAEAIRDCVLEVTGKLNRQAGGPGFLLFRVDRENVHHYFPLDKFEPEHFRRMIYMTKIRQEQDEVFGIFDCPDGGQTIPSRSRSTTALQALNLLNSKFMIEQAGYLAERLTKEAGENSVDQIRLAFVLAFSRPPTQAELDDAKQLIESQGLEAFCRALLNANEFLFVS